jgi:predicted DNA-binding transcriptional regulator AlpA
MNLLTLDEICEIVKLSRTYVRDKLVKRADFPRPCVALSQKTRLWSRQDVDLWISQSHESLLR